MLVDFTSIFISTTYCELNICSFYIAFRWLNFLQCVCLSFYKTFYFVCFAISCPFINNSTIFIYNLKCSSFDGLVIHIVFNYINNLICHINVLVFFLAFRISSSYCKFNICCLYIPIGSYNFLQCICLTFLKTFNLMSFFSRRPFIHNVSFFIDYLNFSPFDFFTSNINF